MCFLWVEKQHLRQRRLISRGKDESADMIKYLVMFQVADEDNFPPLFSFVLFVPQDTLAYMHTFLPPPPSFFSEVQIFNAFAAQRMV